MFKDTDGNYKLKIAFDYDDTLTEESLFALARRLIRKGHDVWIITSRTSYKQYLTYTRIFGIESQAGVLQHADLLETAHKLGIEENKIIFTDGEDKTEFFQKNNFDLLFDDYEIFCNPICEAGGMAVNV